MKILDRTIAVLAAILAVYLLGLAAVHAASFPFEDKDCGTIGNVLAIAAHVRDEGGKRADFEKQAAEALKECQAENGLDGCSIRNQAQQDSMDSMVRFLWDHPKQDGVEFATEFYETCKQRATKPL